MSTRDCVDKVKTHREACPKCVLFGMERPFQEVYSCGVCGGRGWIWAIDKRGDGSPIFESDPISGVGGQHG